MSGDAQMTPADGVHRWLILSIGLAAQAASCIFLYGIPMVLPVLRRSEHLSLAAAGWVVAAPTIGLLCTLIAWGAATDRFGERNVMALGLGLAGVALLGAALVGDVVPRSVLLGLAGAAGASVNAASGKVVLGWFAPHERGTAMGARQTAQPLGVGIAALVLPAVAGAAGIGWALTVPAFACLAVAALVVMFVVDPPRVATVPGLRPRSPYRSPAVWRLHGASTLLVVPQFAISVFSLEYLVAQRHWAASTAGGLLFGFQVLGAAGRVAAGRWSDRAGSRLGPMRLVAVAATVTMLGVALGDSTGSALVVVALGFGAVVTVADNGLGFTAVAEFAGSTWAGRALGAQNTAQNIAASLTPPLLGALIGAAGYGVGFAVASVFPLLAIGITPFAAEATRRASTGGREPSQA
ncbi:MAG: MFS transporter [Actinomycetota bacterium]|nr:MFS transporter [Actinomycetota bacterium]